MTGVCHDARQTCLRSESFLTSSIVLRRGCVWRCPSDSCSSILENAVCLASAGQGVEDISVPMLAADYSSAVLRAWDMLSKEQ